MAIPDEGCAICGSTWGAVWDDVEGASRFFCCSLCLLQYREVVDRVKQDTHWPRVDAVNFEGDRRGRIGTAVHGDETFRFWVTFNSLGQVRRFQPSPATVPRGRPPESDRADPS